ncbi:MAG TPA: HWE histidine kinase domain-containing protein [Microvirga sp.]|nr:HWE histidine kinase domain-containing protein [Microvirga sp.]
MSRAPTLPRLRSTRGYLLGLIAAVVIPLLVFAGLLLVRFATAERDRYARDAVQISRQVALVLDGELAGLLALLKGLASSSALAGGDFARFHEEAGRVVAGSDAVVLLRDLGPRQHLNTQTPFGQELPPAVPLQPEDRAVLESGQPLVGDVYRSPISGEPRVPVVLPVRQDGRSIHLLAVTVPTTRFHAALRQSVPEGWIVGVGDRRGTYVTRSARHEDVSGRPSVPEYVAKATGQAGTFTSRSLEGVELLAGYYKPEFSGWLVAANVARAVVERPLQQSLTLLGLVGTGALGLSLLLAYRLGGRFTRAAAALASQAEALGRGGPVPPQPAAFSEFATVSTALTAAAAAVAERAREREREVEREALLASIFDTAGLSVAVVEVLAEDGRLVAANGNMAARFGLAAGAIEGRLAGTLDADPDDVRAWLALCRQALAVRGPVTTEYAVGGSEGPRWELGTFTPLPGPGRAPDRVAFTGIDITDRKRAEQVLRERTHELEVVLSTVPTAVWFTYDPDVRVVIRNRAAAALMGVPEGERRSLGSEDSALAGVRVSQNGEPLPREEMPLQRALRGETVEGEEFTFGFPDGRERTLLVSALALRDEARGVVGAVSAGLDITDRKRGEEQRLLLVNELNHRVKNTLATVQSIALQTLRGAATTAEAGQALTDRLLALSKAHDVLTRESWEGAHLSQVIAGALDAHAGEGRVDLEGPPVWLPPALSLSLSLALHELATNAVKYGALSAPEGRIRIAWEVLGPPGGSKLRLLWTERGGPAVQPPTRQGFGSRLISRSLSADIGASVSLDYPPEGATCTIEVPLGG